LPSKPVVAHEKLRVFRQSLPKFSPGVLVFLVCYTLIFFETFLQIFSPVVLTPRYVVDSGYGVRGNWPGASYTHYSREFGRIKFKINSKGARADREFSYSKPPGTVRVVAFGDSFTVGFGAQSEETYLEQMRGVLRELIGRNVEVINLGVSGHGTAEELIALQTQGLKFEPDVVLFQWHHTDLQDNIRSQLFGFGESGIERKNETYLPAVDVREKIYGSRFYRFIAGHSMFYSWARNKAAKFTKKNLFEARKVQTGESVEGAESQSFKSSVFPIEKSVVCSNLLSRGIVDWRTTFTVQ